MDRLAMLFVVYQDLLISSYTFTQINDKTLKIFGWHGEVIEEKSLSIFPDLVRQHERWFYGLVQNLDIYPKVLLEKVDEK